MFHSRKKLIYRLLHSHSVMWVRKRELKMYAGVNIHSFFENLICIKISSCRRFPKGNSDLFFMGSAQIFLLSSAAFYFIWWWLFLGCLKYHKIFFLSFFVEKWTNVSLLGGLKEKSLNGRRKRWLRSDLMWLMLCITFDFISRNYKTFPIFVIPPPFSFSIN